jgi:3-carboxy-cis,cis-muconate cycloisomerase/3-oxoadipate enol-lactonase
MSELFDPIVAAGPVAAATDDTAWLQAMLDAEAALARAAADAGLIPEAHADEIAAACRAPLYDAAEIGRAATGIGNPVGPLVRALTQRVGGRAAGAIHRGATSQDILDTAAMLIAHRALEPILDDLGACANSLADLAYQHAATPQVGRTLLQQALPVTFGLTAAGWLNAVDNAADRLRRVREEQLAVQLGGAAGTLASLGGEGQAVVAAFATRLGLGEPNLPWHTDRGRVGELATALGLACAAMAKIAHDLTLLAQTEIAEVSEREAGGSSTMPHKRNPVAAVAAVASAAQAPGLVATLLAASAHEHQRAAGSWHAEWRPFTELLRGTGSAAHWLRTALERLRTHPTSMRANLHRTGGLLMTERITTTLTPLIGRSAAHDAVAECATRAAQGDSLIDLLAAHPVVAGRLDRSRLRALLEPSGYLGSTQVFVDRAIAAHRARPGSAWTPPREITVHHLEYGPADGVPVVLANSIGSTLAIWEPYLKPLADSGFRVIRYDMRGHGDSPVPAGPYTIGDLGADALSLLDRLEVPRAHWVGVSLGGMVGMWLGSHAPERIASLSLCCTSPRPEKPSMWLARAEQARSEGMASIADGSITRWFTSGWRAANHEAAQRMRDITADTPAEGYAACCEALAQLDLVADLPAITAPTLVISGSEDTALPPEHGALIAEAIPAARFELVPGAAHLGTYERFDRFSALITAHLTRNS